MVKLFTIEQKEANEQHDTAWDELYRRFPDVSHEKRRALFKSNYPDLCPNYTYPTVVSSHKYPNSEMHRRWVKAPSYYDEYISRLLGIPSYDLEKLLDQYVPVSLEVTTEHTQILQTFKEILTEVCRLLRALPNFDAIFTRHSLTDEPSNEHQAIVAGFSLMIDDEDNDENVFYVPGSKDQVQGFYRVFPSDISDELAEVTEILMEFVDETLYLIRKDGRAYIERDSSV